MAWILYVAEYGSKSEAALIRKFAERLPAYVLEKQVFLQSQHHTHIHSSCVKLKSNISSSASEGELNFQNIRQTNVFSWLDGEGVT